MFVFRADGNSMIGMGHIMRNISIANQAKNLGHECMFLLASDECRQVIVDAGHSVDVLNSDYSKWQVGEIDYIFNLDSLDAVFVDSYYVSVEFMSDLYEKCKLRQVKLIYIDDRCEQGYKCDYLLNYNIFAEKMNYDQLYNDQEKPTFLIGPKYAPLRKEFCEDETRVLKKSATEIFVSTGGADFEHLTITLVECAAKNIDYNFNIVVGMMNPDREEIKDLSSKYNNINVYENVKRIDKLMSKCDAAISAAGSTLYELCAMSLPTVTYVLADNQMPAAEEFDSKGIIENCGDIRELGKHELATRLISKVISLANSCDYRLSVSKKMKSVVDGQGAKRIIDEIMENPAKG